MPNWRTISGEELLKQCRFEAFRASGPGGQKRNKTSSAVRLVHQPTGTEAIANESRSQHQNRASALKRLRHRLTLHFREPFRLGRESIDVDISLRNPGYPAMMGLALDALAKMNWSVSEAAAAMGLTTARLVRFLQRDDKLMAEVNEQRRKRGLKVLG